MAPHDPTLCFAYFYCTISNTASQSAVNILGSLVAQLARTNPAILENIRSLYDKIPKTQTHSLPVEISALEDAIIRHSNGPSRIVILVDALNESSETESIERSLLYLARLSLNIRILVTTTSTRASSKEANFLNIKAETMKEDIKTFIQYRLEHDNTLRSLTPKLQAEIAETLLKDADGSSVRHPNNEPFSPSNTFLDSDGFNSHWTISVPREPPKQCEHPFPISLERSEKCMQVHWNVSTQKIDPSFTRPSSGLALQSNP